MLMRLEELGQAARQLVGELDPQRITSGDADRLLDAFVALERAAVAGKLLCAAKAAESHAWRQEGHRDAASWLAETMGTGVGSALSTLATARRLQELPVLSDALRRGELSQAQAEVIAGSASTAPQAEEVLVELAGRRNLQGLRTEARRLEATAGLDEEERYDRVRRSRYLRHWREADGGFRFSCRTTEDSGFRILEAVNAGVDAVWEEALAQHRDHDPMEAYRMDALERLVARGDRCTWHHRTPEDVPSRRPSTVHLRVDAAALRRGELRSGEICEVPGVGPVSLATARSILADSVVEALVTDGVDVAAVAHVGRSIPKAVAVALAERDPVCVVPRCEQATDLEIDHYQVAWADGGRSELWNLARLCRHHHRLKTYRGFTLSGGPGAWRFTGPDGVEWTDFLRTTQSDGLGFSSAGATVPDWAPAFDDSS
ncbi:MAG TPA: hypothetical protein VEI83_06030 [Acidimicrobiales bacterium]|nr:hypothetical protein [Acidimicrobiales bacterium]